MLEREIQAKVVEYARECGAYAVKLGLSNAVGIPDYMFIAKGRVLFIEFKAPGKKPTERQLFEHMRMRGYGAEVEVVDNAGRGRMLIHEWLLRP